MIFSIVTIVLISILDLISFRFGIKYALYAHVLLMMIGVAAQMRFCNDFMEQLKKVHIPIIISCAVIGLMIYIADLAIKNMYFQNVIILDWKYYFSGKKITNLSMPCSLAIAVCEEIVFRFPVSLFVEQKMIFLFLGSCAYGIVHSFFSKYDAISKTVIGLILGVSIAVTDNIFYLMVAHATYNVLVGFFGGSNRAAILRKSQKYQLGRI